MQGYTASPLMYNGAAGPPMVAGPEPVMLERRYDPRQLWIPFGNSFWFVAHEPPLAKNENAMQSAMSAMQRRIKSQYAPVSEEAKRLYIYQRDVHQYVLPFVEHKMVTASHFKRLQAQDFPTWERGPNGSIYTVEVVHLPVEPKEWLKENCEGRFHNTKKTMYFQLGRDALRAKLMFG